MDRYLATLAIAVAFTASAFAQSPLTTGNVRGTVRHADGTPFPHTEVTAIDVQTNARRTATTGGDGTYLLLSLPPGNYRLTAAAESSAGAAAETRVVIGQTARLDLTVDAARLAESVEVSAAAWTPDLDRAPLQTTVRQELLTELPIVQRSFLAFIQLTPGVATDRIPQQGATATSGLSFAGQRARSNDIMVDGFDNAEPLFGGIRAAIGQDAVREYQVLAGWFPAEYGGAAGGVVNIVTRSGTNQITADVFAHLRNDALSGKGHFERFNVFGDRIDQPKAPFRQYQAGGSAGWPLVHDNLFAFLSFERSDIGANSFVTVDPALAATLTSAGFSVISGFNPYQVTSTSEFVRLDANASPHTQLAFRGLNTSVLNEAIEPFGGIVARSRGAVQNRKDWSAGVSMTSVPSDRLLNDVRVQYAYENNDLMALDPACGGPCDSTTKGGPTIEIAGVVAAGRQRFMPAPRTNRRLQFADSATALAGHHTFKAGLELESIDTPHTELGAHFGGRYLFTALPGTALALAGLPPRAEPLSPLEAFTYGLPALYVQGYGNATGSYRDKYGAAYAQDEWAPTSRLRIMAGLRYQRLFPEKVHYTISNVGGTTLSYDYPDDTNDLAPRLSAIVDPTGSGRSSLQLAWGRFFERQLLSIEQVSDIFVRADGARTFVAPFPASIVAWRAAGHHLAEPSTPYPSLVITTGPGLRTPNATHTALTFRTSLREGLTMSVDAVDVRGKDIVAPIDFNPRVPELGPGRRPNDVGGVAGTSASVVQYTSFAKSWYDGVSLSFEGRVSQRVDWTASYTLSKAEDNGTDFQSNFVPQNNGRGRNPADPKGLPLGFDPNLERGPSLNDQRHRLAMMATCSLPWSLRLGVLAQGASGRPFTPLAGRDLNNDGDGATSSPDRARRNPADESTSVGRNSARLPSTFTIDLRLSREQDLGGRVIATAFLEVFNLPDRTNYTDVNNVFGAGAFPSQPAVDAAGRVTYGRFIQSDSPRQFQIGVRLRL